MLTTSCIEHLLFLPAGTKLPTGRELPPLFNFTENEMKIQPALNSQLIPPHVAATQQAAAAQPMAAAGAAATSAGAGATAGEEGAQAQVSSLMI